jgi:dihydrofolate synthase/folylpolyglutamate synthase
VPVVSAPQAPAAAAELARRARKLGAPLETLGAELRVTPAVATPRGERFSVTTPLATYPDLELALRGVHQAENAALAVRAAEIFLGRPLELPRVRAAFRAVRWPGRFDVVSTKPAVVVDGAHNPGGAARLAENLDRHFAGRPAVTVLGVSEGKDVAGILAALRPHLAALVAVGAAHPRAMAADRLAGLARKAGLPRVEAAANLPAALLAARRLAGPRGVVVVAGSLYLVGDFLAGQRKGAGSRKDPAPKG